MHPSCPLRPGKAAGMSRACLRPPPPHPNLVGGAGPSPPWLTGPPCPGTGVLSAGHRPAACCIRGGGSMESSLWRQEGPGSPPSPTPGVLCPPPLPPWREPPEPGLGLEKRMDYAGARPKLEPGHGGAPCGLGSGLQARASRLCCWAQGCRPEPADSAGKAVGVASDSSRLGGRCGAQRAPSARADLGQAPIRGSSPERTCLRWDAEAVPTPLSARQGAGVRAGGSESRGLRQRGLRAVGGPALATLSPRFLDLVTVCN